MAKQRLTRPVFFSILFSYFLIMALPMLVLGTLFFGFLYRTYDMELLQNQEDSLQRSQAVMDNVVREMQSNAMILLNSSDFQSSHLRAAYGNFYDVTRRLSVITYTNTFIDEYYYLNSELQRVFSQETMFRYDSFCKYGISYDGMTADNLESMLLKDAMSYWLPMELDGGESFITYLVTDRNSWKRPQNAILFRINESTLNEILSVESASQQNCTMLVCNGQLIYSNSPDFTQKALPQISELATGGREQFKISVGDDDYMVFCSDSTSAGGLRYISAVSFSSLLKTVSFYRRTFLLLLLLVSLLCSFFVLRFMNIIYTPLQQLSSMINKMFGSAPLKNDSEQLSAARQMLAKLQENHRKGLLRDLLLQLLSGAFHTPDELEEDAQKAGLELYGDRFNVILLQLKPGLHDTAPPHLCENIGEFWQNNLPVNISGQFLAFPETASIALLVAGNEGDFPDLYQKLESLKITTENTWDLKLTVGVGEETGMVDIPTAYFQAGKACEYRLFQQNGSLIYFRDILGAEQWKGLYPSHEINNLYHAINRIEPGRIALSLQSLLSDILSNESLIYCNYILRDIMVTSIRALQEVECDTAEVAKLNSRFDAALGSEDALRRYIAALQDAIEQTLSYCDRREKTESGSPVERQSSLQDILSYISAHFCEECFSVKMVADTFHMSVSNLSHFFKKNTGQNISEYIALLRFERAKELLRDTDIVLQEISDQCGYLHLSTFMRQFKQRENCTPSIYRARFRPK